MHKKTHFAASLGWVLTIGVAAVAAEAEKAPPPSASLIVNGGFENDEPDASGRLPAGWRQGYGAVKILGIVAETRPGSSGRQCLKIGADEKNRTGGAYSDFIPIDPKLGLCVSGWVRPGAETGKLRGLYFGVGWFDKDRNPIILRQGTSVNYVYLHRKQAHGQWYKMELAVPPDQGTKGAPGSRIPANAAFCDVRIFALNCPAPGWFDDIEVTQVSPKEIEKRLRAAAPPPSAKSKGVPLAPVKIDSDWVVAWVGDRKAAEAAAELQRYLAQVLGRKVVATPWQPSEARNVFLITDVRYAPKAIAARLEGKRRDAFAIQRPVKWDGQDVCLMVSHDERAYDFPVYCFLTRFMDVHWVGPGELGVVLTPQPDWAMPESISVFENPDFEHRLWSGNSFSSREWLARSSRMGFHHALGHVFHPKKHGDTPEVYPLVGGKRYIPKAKAGPRALSGWQPCTGNPKSVDIAVEHVLSAYERNPGVASVSLSVNDGAGNICMCPLCLAEDGKNAFQKGQRPNLSERFFRFYNKVAERVTKERPDARIAVLGYGPCKKPPTEIKVHPAVHVFEVAPSAGALQAWQAAGAAPDMYLWLWDGGFLTIRPDMRVVADIVRTSHRLGGVGLYSEIIPHWIVSAPKFYVLAGILWDVDRKVDDLLAEYFRLAYGKDAAPAVRAFFEKWWEIYRRRPAEELHQTQWGWRAAEQMEHIRRDDLAAMDAAMARAGAAALTAKQKQRFEHLQTFSELMRINADEYLAGKEMSDPEWLAARSPDEILDAAARTVGLTDRFNRIWAERVAADRSGWLLDERYHKDPDSLWDRFVGQLRTMISSACETALDNAVGAVSARQLAKAPKDKVIAYWEAALQARPALEAYIGPEINELKGVAPENVVPNGGFEKGAAGDPPKLDGWEFYEDYGMVKGVKAKYAWEAGSGRDGGRAIAFGEGRYPEMKGIIRMEKGHRYELSFWYKTVNCDREPSFWIFTYDGPLTTARDIDAEKISRFVCIRLEPTNGEWKKVNRKLTASHEGTHIIQLVSYYQKTDWWTWWDGIELKKIW